MQPLSPLQQESLQAHYEQKKNLLLQQFPPKKDPQQVYQVLLEMGKKLPFLEERHKIKENLVQGCQSRVYLTATLSADQCVFFRVHSDALISSGLAALLLFIYQGETAPFILHCPPLFIRDLGLMQSLSPGRSNGLISMYTKMKKVTINLILNNQH